MYQFRINPRALRWAIALFLIECSIAAFIRDAWIRPYGGDVLAVIFVFACLRTVVDLSSVVLVSMAFAVGVLVELFQWAELPMRLGMIQYAALRTLVGTTFSWGDVACYALGAAAAWWVDRRYLLVRRQSVPSDAS